MAVLAELEQKTDDKAEQLVKQNLKGDWSNFFLLLLLYIMLGLPMGITHSIPIILQSEKKTTYSDQTLLSFSNWPFSFKLLWAPLIDAIYVQKLGRRKSWLIPVQYLLGAAFLFTATNIDQILSTNGKTNIVVLMGVIFVVNLLAAIQDVIVDGWALTMLKKNNVGYASICNSVGHTVGYLTGTVIPILFTSDDFCNEYFYQSPGTGGIVNMKWILCTMGILFIFVSTSIAIFKKEKDFRLEDDYVKPNLIQTYTLMWDVLKLPNVKLLVPALLTMRIGHATTDVSTLKLIDAGLSKDTISILKTVTTGLNIIITMITSKYTAGEKSMLILLKSYPIRLLLSILFAIFVFYTPQWIETNGIKNYSIYYLATFILLTLLQNVVSFIMFVSLMAFIAKKSDPHFGGIYMTMFKTFLQLGRALADTVGIGMTSFFTFKRSSFDPDNKLPSLNCQKENKGDCEVDGYYVTVVLCGVFGIVWYVIFENILKKLQARDISQWTVKKHSKAENVFPL